MMNKEDYFENRLSDNFTFFHLPYPIQVEIISYLSLKDTKSFAITSKESNLLTKDQQMWKKKLWRLAKAINISLENRKLCVNPSTEILTQDPLLIDTKRLYEILGPAMDQTFHSEVDLENLLSKYDPPSIMTFTSIGLQELLHYFQMFFLKPRHTLFHDPFSKGEGAPTFLLFGPPETGLAKKLGLSFVASKGAMFETVGLVRGKPGGLGGGVTVKMGYRLMNFLPVRRARRLKLLLDKPNGAEFHPDVAEVASSVDGLIYYMDARCECKSKQKEKTKMKKYNDRIFYKKESAKFENSWQIDAQSNSHPQYQHDLDHELHELEAMLKVLPEDGIHCPVLVILVRQGADSLSKGVDDDEDGSKEEACDAPGPRKETRDTPGAIHTPSDLHHRLCNINNPWMVINVDVPSLDGVRQGIHWIYERTLLLK